MSSRSSSRSRKLHGWAAFAFSIFAMLLVGMGAGVGNAVLERLPDPMGLAAIAIVNFLAMTLAMGIFVWWWRGIDEAAREAHKWAWWWGGSIGLMVGGFVVLTVMMRPDALPVSSHVYAFPSGLLALMVCQMTGYGLGWVAWWLYRR